MLRRWGAVAAAVVASTRSDLGGKAASAAQHSCCSSCPFSLQNRIIIPLKSGHHLTSKNVSDPWIPKCHLHFKGYIYFYISHPWKTSKEKLDYAEEERTQHPSSIILSPGYLPTVHMPTYTPMLPSSYFNFLKIRLLSTSSSGSCPSHLPELHEHLEEHRIILSIFLTFQNISRNIQLLYTLA